MLETKPHYNARKAGLNLFKIKNKGASKMEVFCEN